MPNLGYIIARTDQASLMVFGLLASLMRLVLGSGEAVYRTCMMISGLMFLYQFSHSEYQDFVTPLAVVFFGTLTSYYVWSAGWKPHAPLEFSKGERAFSRFFLLAMLSVAIWTAILGSTSALAQLHTIVILCVMITGEYALVISYLERLIEEDKE